MRSFRRTLDLVWLKGKALGGFWVGEYDLGSIWPSGLLRREWSAGKERRKQEEHRGPAAERAGDRCWRAVLLAIHMMNSFTPSTSQPHQPSSNTSPDHTLQKAVLCLPASLFLWPQWRNYFLCNIHHLQSPYLFVSLLQSTREGISSVLCPEHPKQSSAHCKFSLNISWVSEWKFHPRIMKNVFFQKVKALRHIWSKLLALHARWDPRLARKYATVFSFLCMRWWFLTSAYYKKG